jgi:hypothetical protein
MSRRTIVELEDDLTGGPADRTVAFALNGTSYEIDLGDANADTFSEALAPYIASAPRVGGRAVSGRRAHSANEDARAVRERARSNGYEVSERGWISAEVRGRCSQRTGPSYLNPELATFRSTRSIAVHWRRGR